MTQLPSNATVSDTLPMHLDLAPRFTFAQFKRVNPFPPDTLWELVYTRNVDTIKVKRVAAVQDNLRCLFEATFRLGNQVGFGAMTLRDLSQATGLSMGGLYGYLQSKDDLAAMIEDLIRHIGRAIPSWFEQKTLSPLERVDCSLRAHLFLSELLQPWFYFVFMESRVLGVEQRKVARAADVDFQAAIGEQVARLPNISSRQAFLLASHLQSMVQSWYVKRWKYRAEKITVDEFANSLSDMIDARLGSVFLDLTGTAG
jgi:AcrR family transcriptional regulator